MNSVKTGTKKALTSLDVRAIVKELSQAITGLYISNIYQVNEVVLFKLHSSLKGTLRLLIIPGVTLHLTKFDFTKPSMPPPFSKTLRRLLKRAIIEEVSQLDFDRIVFIKIKDGENKSYTVVVELIREGNIILLDEAGKIITALYMREFRDRVVKKGLKYIPPPRRGEDPFEVSFPDELDTVEKLRDFLTSGCSISRETVEEICFRVKKLVEQHGLSVKNAVLKVVDELKSILMDGRLKPNVIYSSGLKVNVHPLIFGVEEGLERKFYATFSEALDEYFGDVLKEKIERDFHEEVRFTSRLKASLKEAEKRKEEFEERARVLRQVASLLSSRIHEVDEVFSKIYGMIEEKSFKTACSMAKNFLSSVGIKVDKIEFDPALKSMKIRVEGAEIEVEKGDSGGKIVSKIFSEAKKYERKAEKAEEIITKKLSKTRLKQPELLKRRMIVKAVKSRRWYEKFHWFFSSEGILVLGGRDATQNEVLVKRYLGEGDIFVHADIHGAPVVVVRGECSGETLFEAAVLTAVYSNAWKAGFTVVDVFWVYGRQVSKSPPSGQYLKKGSFMIYGKRNYIRHVPLKLALGIIFEEESFRLIAGPVSAISKATDNYIVIVPGRIDRRVFARKVKTFLEKLSREKGYILDIELQEIMEKLPPGDLEVREVKGLFEGFRVGDNA
ncbi:MAG: NFACT family protein [Thermoproteales archaeon]|nr:NFACT family protein [Thermoproteales archaeon]